MWWNSRIWVQIIMQRKVDLVLKEFVIFFQVLWNCMRFFYSFLFKAKYTQRKRYKTRCTGQFIMRTPFWSLPIIIGLIRALPKFIFWILNPSYLRLYLERGHLKRQWRLFEAISMGPNLMIGVIMRLGNTCTEEPTRRSSKKAAICKSRRERRREVQSSWHLALGLLTSSTEKGMSVVQGVQSVGLYYGGPSRLIYHQLT